MIRDQYQYTALFFVMLPWVRFKVQSVQHGRPAHCHHGQIIRRKTLTATRANDKYRLIVLYVTFSRIVGLDSSHTYNDWLVSWMRYDGNHIVSGHNRPWGLNPVGKRRKRKLYTKYLTFVGIDREAFRFRRPTRLLLLAYIFSVENDVKE